jgi:hypothetical protein
VTTVNLPAVTLTVNSLRNLAKRAAGDEPMSRDDREQLARLLDSHADDLEQAIVTAGDCPDHGQHDGPTCPACKFIAEQRIQHIAERPHDLIVRRTREGS